MGLIIYFVCMIIVKMWNLQRFFFLGAVFVELKELQSQVQIKGISVILFSTIPLSCRNNNKNE